MNECFVWTTPPTTTKDLFYLQQKLNSLVEESDAVTTTGDDA